MKLDCQYLESCRGCTLGHMDFDLQKLKKQNLFNEQLKINLSPITWKGSTIESHFPVFNNYRVRSDFTYQDGKLGWYDKNKNFLAIERCALHSPALTEFAQKTILNPLPIKKGSIRFRLGVNGLKGLWFDLANLDIKTILSGQYLAPYFDDEVIVEMGQKGKHVERLEGAFKLLEPEPKPWFETTFKDQKVPLLGLISSFTQTNSDLNIQMIQIIKKSLGSQKFKEVIEFGSGCGNFTLFLSEIAQKIIAIENDFKNLIPLRQNLKNYQIESKTQIFETLKDFLTSSAAGTISPTDRLYFVNPARSGVGPLFDQAVLANSVLYVSCYLDSFLLDVKKLEIQGFKLTSATVFDQFPHSEHFEIISLFRKG